MTPRQLLFRKFPTIKTDNFVLRKLGHYDLGNLNELFNNPEIQKYQSSNHYSRQDLYDYVESQNETYDNHEIIKWVIERKVDGEFIGLRILYCDDDSGWVEIQGDTKKEFWRKGYTKEVYNGIIGKLRECGFQGIRSVVQTSNKNALFLLKSMGFTLYKEYISNGISFQEYRLKLKTSWINKIADAFK